MSRTALKRLVILAAAVEIPTGLVLVLEPSLFTSLLWPAAAAHAVLGGMLAGSLLAAGRRDARAG